MRLFFICLLVPIINYAQLSEPKGVMVCGHRGGYDLSRAENSISLFESVIPTNGNPIMVELDIRKSKDGTLFLMHDETIDRTTTGTGKIEELTDPYLSAQHLKTLAGKSTSEKIPSFADVLSFAADREVILMLDVKSDVWEDVLVAVAKARLKYRPVVLTFNWNHTQRVINAGVPVITSALIQTQEAVDRLVALAKTGGRFAAYLNDDAPMEWIDQLHAADVLTITAVTEFFPPAIGQQKAEYYIQRVNKTKADILITDTPVEVSAFFNRSSGNIRAKFLQQR